MLENDETILLIEVVILSAVSSAIINPINVEN